MSPSQYKWKVSSSSLRLCLNLMSIRTIGPLASVDLPMSRHNVEQFHWCWFNERWYLYNTKSRNIILSISRSSWKNKEYTYIRYRRRSRYTGILEAWVKKWEHTGISVIGVASNRLSRWERRIARLSNGHSRQSRIQAVSTRARLLYPEGTYFYDALSNVRQELVRSIGSEPL